MRAVLIFLLWYGLLAGVWLWGRFSATEHCSYLEKRAEVLEEENTKLRGDQQFHRSQIRHFDQKWHEGMAGVRQDVAAWEKSLAKQEIILQEKAELLREKAKALLKAQQELGEKKGGDR